MESNPSQNSASASRPSRLGMIALITAIAAGCLICLWTGITTAPWISDSLGLPYAVFEFFAYGPVSSLGGIAAGTGCVLIPASMVLGIIALSRKDPSRKAPLAAIILAIATAACSLLLFGLRFILAMQ
jgi:hypothetical protein